VSGGRGSGCAPRGPGGCRTAAVARSTCWSGGAEPVQFVAVGISLLLGALGAGAQVRAQLIAFAGSLGAHLVQHLLCVGADPSGFSLGGASGGLGAGGFLPA
jgi:hypothetical protein